MGLDTIIKVTILRQTKPTTQVGFNTILIVGLNPTISGRYKKYDSNDLEGIAADLTGGVTDAEYPAATAISSQSPKVPFIALGKEEVGDANMTATLTAIKAENNDFYGVINSERDVAKVTAAGAWCLANKKIYANASSDVNIVDQDSGTDTTSLAYIFNNASNDRVSMFYKSDAATKYTDSAYLGKILGYKAGTYTGFAQTLSGEAADDITTSQETNAHAKACSIYDSIGGSNVVRNGYVSSGEFTDIIHFVDTLEARIQEDIWSIMVNVPKISYDDPGITSIQNAISKRLQIFQGDGAITADSWDLITKERTGGFVVTAPLSSDVPTIDKTNRILKNVNFTCWYSGAIHSVEIQGIVVL